MRLLTYKLRLLLALLLSSAFISSTPLTSEAALALRSATSAYPASSIASVSVVANDLIIVGYSYASNVTTSTISDNASGGTNAYTRIAGTTVPAVGGGGAEVFYAIAKATETLTITLSGISDNGLSVHIVSGNDTNIATVKNVSATGRNATGASQSTSSITTTVADTYIFTYWYQENTNSTLTENGTGFTAQTAVTNHIHGTFDKIVAATGNYSESITVTATTDEWAYLIVAFAGAGGGGGGGGTLTIFWGD